METSSPTPIMLTTEPPLATPVIAETDITSTVVSGSIDTSGNYFLSINAIPAAIATVIIIASMLMLIAGFKLCEYRRVRRMRSNIPKSKNYPDSFSRLCKYRDHGKRRNETEIHRNELCTETESRNISESSDEMESMETEHNPSCHKTVEVEVHQYSSDESASMYTYSSTPTPRTQQTLPKHIKPFRLTFLSEDVMYNNA